MAVTQSLTCFRAVFTSTSSDYDQRDIMKQTKKTSPFFPVLKLPPKFRNLIWRNTVVSAEAIQLEQRGRQHSRRKFAPSLHRSGKQIHAKDDKELVSSRLTVAFTCQQLYLEITPIYCSYNWSAMPLISMITALVEAQDLIKAIRPENARCMQSIYLMLPEIMPLLHQRLNLLLPADVLDRSPLSALESFLVEMRAIFLGEPAIMLSCRTVVMTVLTSDRKAVRLSGQSLF